MLMIQLPLSALHYVHSYALFQLELYGTFSFLVYWTSVIWFYISFLYISFRSAVKLPVKGIEGELQQNKENPPDGTVIPTDTNENKDFNISNLENCM